MSDTEQLLLLAARAKALGQQEERNAALSMLRRLGSHVLTGDEFADLIAAGAHLRNRAKSTLANEVDNSAIVESDVGASGQRFIAKGIDSTKITVQSLSG